MIWTALRREKQTRWDVPQNISGRHDDRSQCIRTWRGSWSCRIHKYLCYNTTSVSPLHCAVSSGENGEHIYFAFSRMFVPWINMLTEILLLCRVCSLTPQGATISYGMSLHGYILSVANHILHLQSDVLSSIDRLYHPIKFIKQAGSLITCDYLYGDIFFEVFVFFLGSCRQLLGYELS